MGLRVGIDLGTTNSAIARIDARGRPVIIPNDQGAPVTPSVVCFYNGATLIGEEAKELQAAGEPGAIAFFKRRMADSNFVFHASGRDYTATDLSALVLGKLRRDAEAVIGEPISDAVITVPAYFRHPQREATKAAGRLAGFNVLQVINEPTAAAIAFGMGRGAREQLLLVYDLGGGTFDVTLLRIDAQEIRVLTSGGDHELGGKDWDDKIVEFLANRFREEHGHDPLADSVSISDLLVRAEEAKKRLSTASQARISITHAGNSGRYDLDRETFERISSDLMLRTIELTNQVLEEMSLVPGQLDGILLVGGSTRMPMVHDFVTRALGKTPMAGVNVDEAVALGAAIVAAESGRETARTPAERTRTGLAGHRQTIDVTNHSLGMIAISEDRSAYINSIILPKNRVIPCVEPRPFRYRTRKNGENFVEIYVTQGETVSPADVTYLGKYVLHDIPHVEHEHAVLDIEYRYDESGTVGVQGRLKGSGIPLRVTVEPLPEDVPARFLHPPDLKGIPQHVTAYLAFDVSGSMTGAPLMEAKKAARGFLANIDLGHCSMGILSVADRVEINLPACQDARKIEKAIAALAVGLGGGNQAEPFTQALKILKKVSGEKFLIVLADGVWADQPRAIRQAQACQRAEINVIAIGFGGADRAFLRAIASTDEGTFFTSLGSLVETFTNIAQVLTGAAGDTQGRSALAARTGRS
jgi:molecular chaperone DnaK (HSP70)